jgi:hypothetical protein
LLLAIATVQSCCNELLMSAHPSLLCSPVAMSW